MYSFDLFHHRYWQPLAYLGITHPFLTIQIDLILTTWLVLALILIFSLIGRYALQHRDSLLYTAYMTITQQGIILVEQSWNGACPERYFLILSSLFIFILTSNWLMLIGIEEPTSNYNTTLALALISFVYTQKEILRVHGIRAWLREYIKTPLSISTFSWSNLPLITIQYILNACLAIMLFPLELMSKCSTILSMSFRLFGNIIAGSIVFSLWKSFISINLTTQLIGLLVPVNIIILGFFGIFEGIIQAFVFTLLTTTYLSLATNGAKQEKI